MSNQSILNAVQNQYDAVARSSLSNESAAVQAVAKAFGYSSDAQAGASGGCSTSACCSATSDTAANSVVHNGLTEVLSRFNANEFAASVRVHALKPANDSQTTRYREDETMKSIQVYDKPMCCSTGVCGPEVDLVLPRFAADLQWLKSQGHSVERFNLAQQPEAFIQNPEVHKLLATQGTNCLPLIVVESDIVSRGAYPSREELVRWTAANNAQSSGCCGGAAKDASKACCAADEQAQATTGAGCGCAETSYKRMTSGCC